MRFIENLLSGFLPFTLLLVCGIFLSFKLKFIQVRGFFKSLNLIGNAVKNKKSHTSGISSLQSACTALSATVGTGNIAGVAGAISLGGAGAVFWMWVSAVLGMAVKYGEISLAVRYREKNGEKYIGGPMFYIKKAVPEILKPLGLMFALAAIPAVICTGNITQTNAAVSALGESFGIKLLIGTVFAFFTFVIIRGGGEKIGKATEKMVPLMSLAYVVLSLGVIFLNIKSLPLAFKMIFVGAFTPKAVTAGAVGSFLTVVVTGASRGVFSNEAGLGTSAMAHSVAYDANAETQGLYGIFEVFVDTIIICTLTALTILCSGVNIDYGNIASSEIVSKSLCLNFGGMAQWVLGIMMCIFAFSSIIGWALYGHICVEYLFFEKAKKIFNIIYPLSCVAGAMFNAETAWRLSAFFNGIMLCINLIAILLLNDKIKTAEGKINERTNKENTRTFRKR